MQGMQIDFLALFINENFACIPQGVGMQGMQAKTPAFWGKSYPQLA